MKLYHFFLPVFLLILNSCQQELSEDLPNGGKILEGSDRIFIRREIGFARTDITSLIRESDSLLFPGINVYAIALSPEGNIWLSGTLEETAHILIEYRKEEAFAYTFPDDHFNLLPVWNFAFNSSGNVYFGNQPGLLEYDGKKFSFYSCADSSQAGLNVLDLCVDQEDNIWLTLKSLDRGGLVKTDLEHWTYFDPRQFSSPHQLIAALESGSENQVYLTLNTYVNNGTVIRIQNGRWIETGKDMYFITGFSIGKNGHAFVTLDYSLSSSSISREDPFVMEYDGKEWYSILNCDSSMIVSCYFITASAGGLDSEFCIADLMKYRIGKFENHSWVFKSLNGVIVNDLEEVRPGMYWLATENGVRKFTFED